MGTRECGAVVFLVRLRLALGTALIVALKEALALVETARNLKIGAANPALVVRHRDGYLAQQR